MIKINPPKVSVLVPVYNSEKHLRTCMDSLVNQSLDNYEIIVINNGSEDSSLEILEEYQKENPGKVHVYTIEHSKFVGTGRNYAISKAKGKYLYMCDSDDIVEKHALTWLYSRAEHYNADVVYGYFNFVNLQNNKVYVMGRDGEKQVTTGELILTGADYWRRLYKRELIDEVIDKVGWIPENTNFDDVAWLPVVHSYAKIIRSADRLIYNYFRRTDSTVGGYSPKVTEYSILSETYALRNCNPNYKNYMELYVARRICNNLENRWIYSDKLIEQIKENWDSFKKNEFILSDTNLYSTLKKYNNLSSTPFDKIVYLNGFEREYSQKEIDRIKHQAFDKCDCVVLSPSNCNINELEIVKKAYMENRLDFVAGYFALKNIYETGGIYISPQIKIDKPFNSLRYFESFFCFLDRNSISDEVFGGQKGGRCFERILKTYQVNRYTDLFYPLGKRIKNILNVEFGVDMEGTTDLFTPVGALLDPSVMVMDIHYGSDVPANRHICIHDFSDELDNRQEEIAVVNKSSIECVISGISAPKYIVQDTKENAEILQERNFYKYRVEMIELSRAYKLALLLSKFVNKFKILRVLLKLSK